MSQSLNSKLDRATGPEAGRQKSDIGRQTSEIRGRGQKSGHVKKARLVLDLQGRRWHAFALRGYRRDHVNVLPFLSLDDKTGRFALLDEDTA
jgi:hypothetical protein